MLLVKIANPKIANLVVMIPNQVSEIIAYLATIFITVDAVQSFNEAINLKNVLVKITERNETVSVIKKRLEIVEAFINEDIKDLQGRILDKLEIQQERKSEKKTKKAMHIEAIIRKNLSITEEKIRGLSEKISLYMDKLEGVPFRGSEDTEHLKLEFKEYINKLRMHESRIHNTENNVYIKSIKILRRNPNAKAKKYEEAMNEIKNLDKELNDK